MTPHPKHLLLSLAILIATSLSAAAADWVVSKVNQPAHYSTNNQTWHDLSIGAAIPTQSWIRTGERGMLLLGRDAESILLKPGTLVRIEAEFDGRAGTSLSQRSGAILLDIETRDEPHTRVRTPFLAAVVKGTKFEVRVGKWDAELDVQRGVVEVTHIRRGERIELGAGQSARVGETAMLPIVLRGATEKPQTSWVSPAEPSVSVLAYGDAPHRWGAETSGRADHHFNDAARARFGIGLAVFSVIVLVTLLQVRRQRPTATHPASVPDADTGVTVRGDKPRAPAAERLSGEAPVTTFLVGILSACLAGLATVSIPGLSPVAVLSAMCLALIVLLMIAWLVPSARGATLADDTPDPAATAD